MNWTAMELRQLRWRLGWSQAEFARRMDCDLTLITKWELGEATPDEPHRQRLVHLFNQIEMHAEKVQLSPVAEVIMKDRGLDQIHDSEVKESLHEGSFPNGPTAQR